MPAPSWRGFLRLALVTCPVALVPAVSERDVVRFNTLNSATGNRVSSQWKDSGSGEVVESWELVRAYEVGRDQYLPLEDEELQAVRLESVNILDVSTFVEANGVSRIWRETPYFLVPDDPVGVEAYTVIRTAMDARGVAGLSRLVRGGRERPVLIAPRGKGFVLWTLRLPDEIRSTEDAFASIKPVSLPPDLLQTTQELMGEMAGHWNRKRLKDPRRDKLLAVIDAKRAGRKPRPPAPPSTGPSPTANIFDALKRSLEEQKVKRKG